VPPVIVVYYNDRETLTCDASDEERVKRDFFKTRDPACFKRLAVDDFVYVRASARNLGGNTFGLPCLLLTTNLSSDKL
jgi:hypothetical protein